MFVKLVTFTTVICIVAMGSCAPRQLPTGQSSDPKKLKAMVEQICKLDSEGRWLAPEHHGEIYDYFYSEGMILGPQKGFSVIKSYQVGDLRKEFDADVGENYQFEVKYLVWGEVDPLLHFKRATIAPGKSPAPVAPVAQSAYQRVTRRDKIIERSPDGRFEKKNAALRWRMERLFEPHVEVQAGINYVAEMRKKTDDPVTKYNAEKTLAVLRTISAGAADSGQEMGPAQQPALAVARKFFHQESTLGPDHWGNLGKFFLENPKPQLNSIQIIDGMGVDAEKEDGRRNLDAVEAVVYTNSLGDLDSSMQLRNYPSERIMPGSPSACSGEYRIYFTLLKTDVHWEIAQDGTVKQLSGPYAWRIEDPVFWPLLTLNTAIRYVTETREKTSDPTIKRNADRTFTILRLYRSGKPLPKNLRSDSDAGCSGG